MSCVQHVNMVDSSCIQWCLDIHEQFFSINGGDIQYTAKTLSAREEIAMIIEMINDRIMERRPQGMDRADGKIFKGRANCVQFFALLSSIILLESTRFPFIFRRGVVLCTRV